MDLRVIHHDLTLEPAPTVTLGKYLELRCQEALARITLTNHYLLDLTKRGVDANPELYPVTEFGLLIGYVEGGSVVVWLKCKVGH